MNLEQRIRRIETGLDVSRLSREQLRMLDMSKLTRGQVQSLDVSQLTDEQLFQLDFKSLTDAQLAAVSKGFDEQYPEMAAVIHSMGDEELKAVKERRLDVWYPGYSPDSTE